MAKLEEKLPDRCPSCGAERRSFEIETDDPPSAEGRYSCGAALLVFGETGEPLTIAYCPEKLRRENAGKGGRGKAGEKKPRRRRRRRKRRREDDFPATLEDDLLRRADLEGLYLRLGKSRHFYAEAMRGRIRSLELRSAEARVHFGRALRRVGKRNLSAPNLRRVLSLQNFVSEDMVLDLSEDLSDDELPARWGVPLEVVEFLRSDAPEFWMLVRERIETQARVLLRLGRPEEALDLLREIVDDEGDADALAGLYLLLAAAEDHIGLAAAARGELENAGLATRAAEYLLTKVRAAGALFGLWRYFGGAEEAESWREFLLRLDCPEPTKEVFLRRGREIAERSERAGRVVLL